MIGGNLNQKELIKGRGLRVENSPVVNAKKGRNNEVRSETRDQVGNTSYIQSQGMHQKVLTATFNQDENDNSGLGIDTRKNTN